MDCRYSGFTTRSSCIWRDDKVLNRVQFHPCTVKLSG